MVNHKGVNMWYVQVPSLFSCIYISLCSLLVLRLPELCPGFRIHYNPYQDKALTEDVSKDRLMLSITPFLFDFWTSSLASFLFNFSQLVSFPSRLPLSEIRVSHLLPAVCLHLPLFQSLRTISACCALCIPLLSLLLAFSSATPLALICLRMH